MVRRSAGIVIGCAVVVTGALAGCGSTQAGSTTAAPVAVSPTRIVLDAATTTSAARTAHVVLSSTVTLDGQNLMVVKASGDEAFDQSAGHFSMTMTVMGRDVALQEVVAHRTAYVKSAMTGPKWLEVHGALPGNGTSPSDALAMLQKLGDVTEVGPETRAGVATTHYTGTVDLREALTRSGLSSQLTAQVQKTLGTAAMKPARIDVWVDAQGRVVAVRDALTLTVQGRTMAVLADVALSDFGVAVTDVAPPASDVTQAPPGLLGGA